MTTPSDVIGDWNFTVQPDAFGDFAVTLTLSIASVAVNGTMTGQIKNGPALSKGKFVQGSNTSQAVMSFILNLAGTPIFLAGVVTGSKPNCKFDGHYLLVSQNAGAVTAAAATFDDPGDTGTAGGQ